MLWKIKGTMFLFLRMPLPKRGKEKLIELPDYWFTWLDCDSPLGSSRYYLSDLYVLVYQSDPRCGHGVVLSPEQNLWSRFLLGIGYWFWFPLRHWIFKYSLTHNRKKRKF